MRQASLGSLVIFSISEQVHPVMFYATSVPFSFFYAHLCYGTNFFQLKLKE